MNKNTTLNMKKYYIKFFKIERSNIQRSNNPMRATAPEFFLLAAYLTEVHTTLIVKLYFLNMEKDITLNYKNTT
jgi:hypothetical protein